MTHGEAQRVTPPARYLATVLPGLEPVAADELAKKVPTGTSLHTRRGRLTFDYAGSPEALLRLRSVDNLYRKLGTFTVGPHRAHLRDVTEAVASLASLETAAIGAGTSSEAGTTFWVNASRRGRHTYSRFEAADAAAAGLARVGWRLGSATEHALEFRLDIEGEQAILSRRLTPASFRFRGDERVFAAAALRPPVAHALVWLSEPEPTDRFLDPFCGSGTIVAERLAYPAERVLGSDLSPAARAAAEQNLPPRPELTIATWDARHLPLEAGSVDKVVTNFPFGRQVLTPEEVGPLALDFARELQRILTPQGQAIILVDPAEAFFAAVERTRLRAVDMAQVSLKGVHPQVLRVTRR